jgi:uncharacterized membrane protein (DUF4010 family)
VLSNSVVKAAMTAVVGGVAFARKTVPGFAVMLALGGAALLVESLLRR